MLFASHPTSAKQCSTVSPVDLYVRVGNRGRGVYAIFGTANMRMGKKRQKAANRANARTVAILNKPKVAKAKSFKLLNLATYTYSSVDYEQGHDHQCLARDSGVEIDMTHHRIDADGMTISPMPLRRLGRLQQIRH
ncbi:unnamed protein product [Mesocestoides corti]|uniref:Transposase n=1 Tax=Mesocestoides corti TaxID=53468 RepID=A0A0R3UB92_MESCO|nr:unnamed protein product [Mesocestoides corti]